MIPQQVLDLDENDTFFNVQLAIIVKSGDALPKKTRDAVNSCS